MGYHVEERSFQPSVRFITTDTKREPETRIPAVRAHAGAWEEARPGCTVKRLMQLERDMHGARTAHAQAKLVITKRVSVNGVLRYRRLVT
jgi:hypothetical protein